MKLCLKLLGLLVLTSCSVAKFSSMPKTAMEIDFVKYENDLQNTKEPLWSSNTSNEYFFVLDKACQELELLEAVGFAFTKNNFGFSKFNKADKVVFAERGARLNDWKSIAGIYYKIDTLANKTRFYILVKITQDIIGGWKENRAKKIGLDLEKLLKK
jgi:hypothetical protein